MSAKISGEKYAMMYGPTTGDKVRLADTDLVIEVEKDYTTYGDECKFGGGKTLRDGMGQSVKTTSADGDLDLVITNATKQISELKTERSQASARPETLQLWTG